MTINGKLVSLVAAAVLGIPLAVQAATYDAGTDFATASDPNGVWTYGDETTLGGTLTLYNSSGTENGNLFWRPVNNSLGAPADAYNPDSVQHGFVPGHTAAFHPGPNGEFSIFRFTAPTTGLYGLTSSFGALDSGGTDIHVLVNNIQVSPTFAITPSTPSASFNTSLLLTMGDIVDFAVGFGGDGNFFSDSTSIAATFTTAAAVPEPQTYAMLALGLALIGFTARRRTIC